MKEFSIQSYHEMDRLQVSLLILSEFKQIT